MSPPVSDETEVREFERIFGPNGDCKILGAAKSIAEDYRLYQQAQAEHVSSEIWKELGQLQDAATGLLGALHPFLTPDPQAHVERRQAKRKMMAAGRVTRLGSGPKFMADIALWRDFPTMWGDQFWNDLRQLRDAAGRAAELLRPYEGPGRPGNKRVDVTRRALKLLPDEVDARRRNAFVGLVFGMAGEKINKGAIRELVREVKRHKNVRK
jgi:hypothetical protein